MDKQRGEGAIPEVTALEAHTLVAQGALLLDVREPEEWQAGRAPMARHIPLGALGANLDQLPKERTVVVVCRSGGRSALAADALIKVGYDALNLAGGMQAWDAADLEVLADGGGPGEIV